MEKKKIKILTRGPIRVKGFINGPVLTPYMEDIDSIFAMITAGINVVEVLSDNTEVTLTANNFNINNGKAEEKKPEPVEEVKEETPVVEEAPATVEVEESITPETVEITDEPTQEEVHNDNNKYNNKFNKKKKR